MMEPVDNPRESMLDVDSLLDSAMAFHQQNELDKAETLYAAILSREPRHFSATHLLGLISSSRGDFQAAAERLRRAVALNPRSALAHLNLGLALWNLGQPEEALKHYHHSLRFNPNQFDALFNCGLALQTLQRPAEAVVTYELAKALKPDSPGLLMNLASVLHQLERHTEALVNLDLVLDLQPENVPALYSRATVLRALQRSAEALASCDLALAAQPDCAEAHVNRGNALGDLNRTVEALASYERAVALQPDSPDLLINCGTALHHFGRHQEALACYDRALTLDPSDAKAHSGKIALLEYISEGGFQEHQQERQRFFEAHASRFTAQASKLDRDRDPTRKLILGYVSADFRNHATATIFLPILQRHSRTDFQINCYSGVSTEDHWTQRCKGYADVWRQTTHLPDEALDQLIRDDGVDILIDLSGHSAGNRLLVFARKPAPIQVSAWGHGGGTGLPAVDYLFADPVAIPGSVRPLFAEEVYDLPCHITFEAPADAPPLVDLPAQSRGWVTFGCLNRYSKVTPAVEQLWARILAAVPHARLLLKAGLFDDPRGRRTVLESFAQLGIEAERIEFRGATSRRDHLAAYGDVDILLDPFPQNGGITTMESLWMGTPVLAKLGHTLGSRASGAILHALDLADWVAQSENDYLEVALRKAADIEALVQFRRGIRARFMASPTGNPERYTQAVEAAYRTMWLRWLKQSPWENEAEALP